MSNQGAAQRVLVTGATGFLGGHICAALEGVDGVHVIAGCREPDRLPAGFTGEVRAGDLTDPGYRRAVVAGVDAICHAGTWAAMWGHRADEERNFYGPALDLAEQAVAAGVDRFVLSGTVVTGPAGPDQSAPGLASAPFWPHLDLLIDLDRQMQRLATTGATQFLNLRLGHFVGPGNRLGLVPALVPRLRSRIVPWLARGRARMPLVTGEDLGAAFSCAVQADLPRPYDSIAICGPEFPTSREVIEFVAIEAGSPKPWFSVPYGAAALLARVLERTNPVLPGKAPFLTRSIVHLARDWHCPDERATSVLGYRATGDWRPAVRESIAEIRESGSGWPALMQHR